jgi:hypothetical protein
MLPRNTGPSELAFKKEMVMLGHPIEELKLMAGRGRDWLKNEDSSKNCTTIVVYHRSTMEIGEAIPCGPHPDLPCH